MHCVLCNSRQVSRFYVPDSHNKKTLPDNIRNWQIYSELEFVLAAPQGSTWYKNRPKFQKTPTDFYLIKSYQALALLPTKTQYHSTVFFFQPPTASKCQHLNKERCTLS